MSLYAIIFFIVIFIIDLYLYKGLKNRFRLKKWHTTAYCIISLLTWSIFLYYYFSGKQSIYYSSKIFVFGIAQSIFFSKTLLLPFLLISDIGRLFRYIFRKISSKSSNIPSTEKYLFFKFGIAISIIFFGILIYGISFGAYQIEKAYVEIEIADLPEELEGLKMIQISDVHLGSFASTEPVKKAVQIINEENADFFFFTGDLVNDKSSEIEPYVDILSSIQTKSGKFMVMGNHDYSPYITWESEEAKHQNLLDFYQYQKKIGWKVLNNESEIIEINNKKVAILGVEYWGKSIRWGQYGDLDKALLGTDSANLKILLSHDPSHFDLVVSQEDQYKDVSLTLSGHTHGFQFGIDLPNWKWSPSQWVYPRWIGLYEENQRQLYVNKGLGFLGYPGRVGIAPEITIITLTKKKDVF